jgi:hypothetical protein
LVFVESDTRLKSNIEHRPRDGRCRCVERRARCAALERQKDEPGDVDQGIHVDARLIALV